MKKNNGTVLVGWQNHQFSADYTYATSSSNYIDVAIKALKRKILK